MRRLLPWKNGREDRATSTGSDQHLKGPANTGDAVPVREAPLVIGAIGGSGTRVISRIARDAGYFIGTHLNEAEDAQDFPLFYDRWINRYILRRIAPLCVEEDRLMLSDFEECITRHRSTIPDENARWSWKEPRSIYLLEFFHQIYPSMKFVHVVRDGRDMAFSSNQNQLRKHGRAALGDVVEAVSQPVASAMLWAHVNGVAAHYGEHNMPGSYLRVCYEQLCFEPVSTIESVLRFLQVKDIEAARLAADIKPTTVGRWRNVEDKTIIEEIHSCAGEALTEFGYR